MVYYPYAPWCWNMYLHDWAIFGVNVGKYSMEHLGMNNGCFIADLWDWDMNGDIIDIMGYYVIL